MSWAKNPDAFQGQKPTGSKTVVRYTATTPCRSLRCLRRLEMSRFAPDRNVRAGAFRVGRRAGAQPSTRAAADRPAGTREPMTALFSEARRQAREHVAAAVLKKGGSDLEPCRTSMFTRDMRSIARLAAPLIAVLAVQTGCSGGERNFRIVQVCLHDASGVQNLRVHLQSIAASRNLDFIDRSAETQEELRRIAPNNPQTRPGEPFINMGINGPGGIGVTASNLGLPGHQAALGFRKGAHASVGPKSG